MMYDRFAGMLSSAASQGLVWRWDFDVGLSQCDRFLYVNDDYIKVSLLKCDWKCFTFSYLFQFLTSCC